MITPGQHTLLIADPFLQDPNFMRTVIYLCRHGEEGSLGFVLNKLFKPTLGELINGLEGTSINVYYGGPVQPDTVHFIHQYPSLIPEGIPVSDEIYWGGDFDTARQLLLNGRIDPEKIKFFIGYSGWEKGQLDAEISEHSWLTATANRKLVFETDPEEIWKESLRHLGGKYEQMIHFPIDPQLN